MTTESRVRSPGFCRQCQKSYEYDPHVCETLPSKNLTLQQRAMSALSTLQNTGQWDRQTVYELVREMLDSGWNQPAQTEICPCGAFEFEGQVLHASSCNRVIDDAEAAGLCLVIPVGESKPVHPRCGQYPDCPCGGPQPDETGALPQASLAHRLRVAFNDPHFDPEDLQPLLREVDRLESHAEKTDAPPRQSTAGFIREHWGVPIEQTIAEVERDVDAMCTAPDVSGKP